MHADVSLLQPLHSRPRIFFALPCHGFKSEIRMRVVVDEVFFFLVLFAFPQREKPQCELEVEETTSVHAL